MAEKQKEEKAAPAHDLSYLHQRLKPLGWTEEKNLVEILQHEAPKDGKGLGKNVKVMVPMFEADEDGNILIHYFNINGTRATFKRGDSNISKPFIQKRWRVSRFDTDGRERKYEMPYGTSAKPWFAPNLLRAYEEATKLDTLFLTEGAIKAFAGYVLGLHVVGLASISLYKESKNTFTLPVDVLEIIKRCKPTKVVWLVDGDCRDLSREWQKMIEAEDEARENGTSLSKDASKLPDLSQRPSGFLNSAINIRELLHDYGVDVYFAHVQSETVEGRPKGLDDLILAYTDSRRKEAMELQRKLFMAMDSKGRQLTGAKYEKALKEHEANVQQRGDQAAEEAAGEIVQDLTSYSAGQPRFIHRMNITASVSRLRTFFGLASAEQFYQTYGERIGERVFKYHGTSYRWVTSKNELEMVIPGASKDYARVGDTYYEWVMSPRKMRDGTMVMERVLDSRQKGTIVDDHNKAFVQHIPRYKRFCNIPDHVDFQQVVHNCLNVYYPFEHKSEDGECPATMRYLAHIFGTGTVQFTHPKKRGEDGKPERFGIKELDLGLDYIQLLYQKPTQILPILCLVSNERNTGKTTLAKWLKLLFTSNAVMVGNSDFENDFNSLWATKLLVMCDEAFIDKKKVIERIKSLSTADRISMNAKGKDQVEVDFFAKFILLSNNEENFANIDEPEVRFWVRKVPPIPDGDLEVDLLSTMREEIPAFLQFLDRRQMATENLFRAWFDPKLLVTEALKRVVEYNKPTVIKELHEYMREIFFRTRQDEVLMDADDVRAYVFGGNRYERNYLNKLLGRDLHIDRYKNTAGQYVTKDYEFPVFEIRKDHSTGNVERVKLTVKGNGRPFVFKRDDFVANEEWEAQLFESSLLNAPAPSTPNAGTATNSEYDDLF